MKWAVSATPTAPSLGTDTSAVAGLLALHNLQREHSLFSVVSCPLCGKREHTVVSPSRYPKHVTVEQLQQAFRASSDEKLMDQLVQCRSCQLTYVNPRINTDLLVESYESAVDPEFIEQNPERVRTFAKLLRKTLRRVGYRPSKGARLLDVGCAGGAFLVAARSHGFETTGVEPSHWLSAWGRKTYGLNIHQGILRPGMFPHDTFDVITLWDVIEHIADPKEVLDTILALLKPNGLLLVNYPDVGSWMAKLLGENWPFLLNVHLLYYTRQTMRRQLETAGFTLLHMRPHFQALKLGYILKRMTPCIPLAGACQRLVEGAGLASLPVTYNMGQTLVVARKYL